MRINFNFIYCVQRGKPPSFIGESCMKELKQCCLRHVSGELLQSVADAQSVMISL